VLENLLCKKKKKLPKNKKKMAFNQEILPAITCSILTLLAYWYTTWDSEYFGSDLQPLSVRTVSIHQNSLTSDGYRKQTTSYVFHLVYL
jgi:hypothetical protein